MLFDLKEPDLAPSFRHEDGDQGPTDDEVRVAKQYTRIRLILVEGEPEAHTAWLMVGGQQFRLNGHSDTPGDASWQCWMLAKAILKIQREV